MRRILGFAVLAAAGMLAAGSRAADRRASSTRNRYESNYTATWTKVNNIDGRVTTLSNQFTAGQVAFLAGLTSTQIEFLSNLSAMTTPTSFPLPDDTASGASWASGERAYVNSAIDMCNNLIEKMQRNGLMIE